MEKFLADTTLLVDHFRGDVSAFNFLKNKSPYISHVTLAELIQEIKTKEMLQAVSDATSDLFILPINEAISQLGIDLMKKFFHSHHLEYLDALIAATAIEENLILVTANTKHFSFIKSLSLVDWKKEKARYSPNE
ncbi:type II toxin-antitoxin system VapC family toxin [Candidatus Gottesmanbacteria bacterium]|nr:type II toxin-antitoxin system VapC family toxin [Candidatus Gottesmanbacteria bacterium]MBI5452713.1 type II toxin-antitoxin system VapC family toxin [Candidatus Gottesmanbacteria bacterium]